MYFQQSRQLSYLSNEYHRIDAYVIRMFRCLDGVFILFISIIDIYKSTQSFDRLMSGFRLELVLPIVPIKIIS